MHGKNNSTKAAKVLENQKCKLLHQLNTSLTFRLRNSCRGQEITSINYRVIEYNYPQVSLQGCHSSIRLRASMSCSQLASGCINFSKNFFAPINTLCLCCAQIASSLLLEIRKYKLSMRHSVVF